MNPAFRKAGLLVLVALASAWAGNALTVSADTEDKAPKPVEEARILEGLAGDHEYAAEAVVQRSNLQTWDDVADQIARLITTRSQAGWSYCDRIIFEVGEPRFVLVFRRRIR